MQPQNFKFGTIQTEHDTTVERYFYPNAWSLQKTSGPERLIIAPASGHIELMLALSRVLPEPFGLLYVLLVPRGGNPEGRYQSVQPANRVEIETFLSSFSEFFENDARHHIWIASLSNNATLVYDKHNVIYAYGMIEQFKSILAAQGLTQGDVPIPELHAHLYNPQFDAEEVRVLSYIEWKQFPLAEIDD